MKVLNKLFFTCSVIFIGLGVQAQESLPADTFKIVKSYRPTILDAEKIDFQPKINDTLKIETKPEYKFIQKQVPVSFNVDTIPAARIKGEPLVKLYNGYVKLGVGNALVPYGEAYYTNLRSKKYVWGVHGKYWNMNEVSDIEGSDRSNAYLGVFAKRFWRTNTLEGRLGYEIDQLNYYGYYDLPVINAGTELPASALEQNYNRFNADFKLKTTKRDSFNLRHEASLHYGMMANEGGRNENHFRGDLNLSQFRNSELYELDVLIDHNQYEFNDDNTIISLKPQISTIANRFKVKVGLGLYMNAGDDADFHFYPLAEVKYNVIKDVLIPYAGLKGEIRRVNYQSITRENPFVSEQILLRNNNELYNLYLGLRGTLSSKLSFNINGSVSKIDDSYFYIQGINLDRLQTQEFFLIYDDLEQLKLKGEFIYRHNDRLKISGLAEYYNFDRDNGTEAWHRPEIKANLAAHYNLRDKIIVKADFFYWGEQFARSITAVQPTTQFATNTLDAIFDANLGIEYRYTKRLSAFVQFNNIGGINYEKYQNYALQGFNFWGGLTYGF